MANPELQRSDSKLGSFLNETIDKRASDLHLGVGTRPYWRIDGSLEVGETEKLTADDMTSFLRELGGEDGIARYESHGSVDLAFSWQDTHRFRVNAYRERGRLALAIRLLADRIMTLDELGLPSELRSLSKLKSGLVLVTGPTGSGKSTSLAAILDMINRERAEHIITIEDPVEYLHENHRALVHQRALGEDVPSFSEAVRDSLREDPDVLLVGEMRDLATMRAAVTAAETGHLVFSTLHSIDCVGAVERILGVFPGDEQALIRQQLSMVLRAVVAQRLLPKKGGGRIPVIEYLVCNKGVANLIRSDNTAQIPSMIETGSAEGMQTFDTSLARLVASSKVRMEDAIELVRDPRHFEARCAQIRQGGIAR